MTNIIFGTNIPSNLFVLLLYIYVPYLMYKNKVVQTRVW